MELPTHIGGYQHLEPDVEVADGDILVVDGRPYGELGFWALGRTVLEVEMTCRANVYRKYACPRQGGDRPLTDDERNAMALAQERAVQEITRPHLNPEILPAKKDRLPSDPKARKQIPLASGLLDYFPDALIAVAELSRIGNDQHNPGKPLHWDRSKSGDEADALMRHLIQRNELDSDGVPHAVKVAWRGLAMAQKWIESSRAAK